MDVFSLFFVVSLFIKHCIRLVEVSHLIARVIHLNSTFVSKRSHQISWFAVPYLALDWTRNHWPLRNYFCLDGFDLFLHLRWIHMTDYLQCFILLTTILLNERINLLEFIFC